MESQDDTDSSNSIARHRRESSRPYSAHETAKALTTPLEQTYSIDSKGVKREKRSPHKVRRSKVGQSLRKGMRKSVKAMKYIFTGKIFVKGFYHFKRASASLMTAVKKPFSLRSAKKNASQIEGDTMISKNTMIDEELAYSLINTHMEDEPSVVRASRYVATGRDLLN